MATDNQPQDLDQQADAPQEDLSFNFLDDVSDESLVAQISSAKTGMDIPSDLAPEPVQDAPTTPTPEAQNKGIGSPEKTKPEPLNFANLRKAREAAERERDQLREERDSLLQRAQEADLTKAEKAQLAQDLDAARKELSEKTEAITRVSARETPEYKQVYNLYQEG